MCFPAQTLGSSVRISLEAWKSAFILLLCCTMQVAALWWADLSSEESCQLYVGFITSEWIQNMKRPGNLILQGREGGRKNSTYLIITKLYYKPRPSDLAELSSICSISPSESQRRTPPRHVSATCLHICSCWSSRFCNTTSPCTHTHLPYSILV
jgi:hypothetical protein